LEERQALEPGYRLVPGSGNQARTWHDHANAPNLGTIIPI
jgi:hypothetical protein